MTRDLIDACTLLAACCAAYLAFALGLGLFGVVLAWRVLWRHFNWRHL